MRLIRHSELQLLGHILQTEVKEDLPLCISNTVIVQEAKWRLDDITPRQLSWHLETDAKLSLVNPSVNPLRIEHNCAYYNVVKAVSD